MQKYRHIQEFKIKYCEVDYKDDVKLSTVLSYLEEVACASGDELGFGYDYIKPRGFAFMISSICCEFYQPMRLGDNVKVATWPTPPTYAVFGREYQMENPINGELLLAATSRWCLIDMKSGKIASSKVIDNQDYSTYNTDRALVETQWKIPQFPLEEGKLGFSLKIAHSEYDHNMHVNNTRYADYCLNCFSMDELNEQRLKKFQISYCKQCREGDELRFYRRKEDNGDYVVQGVNQADERVVLCRLSFENSSIL